MSVFDSAAGTFGRTVRIGLADFEGDPPSVTVTAWVSEEEAAEEVGAGAEEDDDEEVVVAVASAGAGGAAAKASKGKGAASPAAVPKKKKGMNKGAIGAYGARCWKLASRNGFKSDLESRGVRERLWHGGKPVAVNHKTAVLSNAWIMRATTDTAYALTTQECVALRAPAFLLACKLTTSPFSPPPSLTQVQR
jgi:hypothetical protein